MKEVLLFSGGIDSYIAWKWLGQDSVDLMYFDLGTEAAVVERRRVMRMVPDQWIHRLTIVEDLSLGRFEEEDANLPQRNMFMCMYAANEGYDTIWLVVQKDEMSIPDRSVQFFYRASEMISFLVGRRVDVATPFTDLDKTEMVAWIVNRYGAEECGVLQRAWGCFHGWVMDGMYIHCGDCPACFRKFVALKNNGIDPGYVLTDRIKRFYREKLFGYSVQRQERMKKWL